MRGLFDGEVGDCGFVLSRSHYAIEFSVVAFPVVKFPVVGLCEAELCGAARGQVSRHPFSDTGRQTFAVRLPELVPLDPAYDTTARPSIPPRACDAARPLLHRPFNGHRWLLAFFLDQTSAPKPINQPQPE